jgi:hypothetical protein
LILSTTHERSLYSGKFHGEEILVCQQVDDLAVASAKPSPAPLVPTMTCKPTLAKLNGVDVEQTSDLIRIHCHSYIDKVSKSHGWAEDSKGQGKTRFHEPINDILARDLEDAVEGPDEGTVEALQLEKDFGYSYWTLLADWGLYYWHL